MADLKDIRKELAAIKSSHETQLKELKTRISTQESLIKDLSRQVIELKAELKGNP